MRSFSVTFTPVRGRREDRLGSFPDHFDQLVQEKLRKDLPIVTTSHAQEHLSEAQLGFSAVVSVVNHRVRTHNSMEWKSGSPR